MDFNNKRFALNPSFVIIEKLGQGSYGEVYKVHDKTEQKDYAIKVIKKQFEAEGIPTDALREITILKKMNHPNIIRLNQIFTGKNHIELCLDYCDFDLKQFKEKYMEEESIYNDQTITHIMFQILKGMDYLHSKMIMHRDLKPQNILVNYTNQLIQVRIGDFGLSRKFTIPNKQYTKEVSTLWYRAPELMRGNCNYSIGVDIWSIGCIFAELYLNCPLFQGESELDQLNQIFRVFGTNDDDKLIGANLANVYYPQFKKTQSIGLANIMKEKAVIPYSNSSLNLIELMLQIDPAKRITCKDALKHVRLFIINL